MKTGEERGLPELGEKAQRWESLYPGSDGTLVISGIISFALDLVLLFKS